MVRMLRSPRKHAQYPPHGIFSLVGLLPRRNLLGTAVHHHRRVAVAALLARREDQRAAAKSWRGTFHVQRARKKG